MAADGWIKLHRKTLHCKAVNRDADHFYHWAYILMNASHKEVQANFGDKRITLMPGQFITGVSKMASDLKCNKSKTYRILKRYENEMMIETQTCAKGTLISVLNWEVYQGSETESETKSKQNRNDFETILDPNKKKEERRENYISSKEDTVRSTSVDYQAVVDKFNSICVSYGKVKSLSEARKKAIKARLNTYTIDDLITAFEKAEASDFMKGKNNRNWTATFDWILKDTNLAKVLEGNYDNKGVTNGNNNWNGNSGNNQTEVRKHEYGISL